MDKGKDSSSCTIYILSVLYSSSCGSSNNIEIYREKKKIYLTTATTTISTMELLKIYKYNWGKRENLYFFCSWKVAELINK